MRVLKPPRLRQGQVVGLVAPASPPRSRALIQSSVRYLERQGYRVELGHHIEARHGWLAGTDAERAADLNAMLNDPRVSAVFALRGGYGSPRLLPRVDYAAVRRQPKIVAGFSDVSALQLALWRRVGLVTFSGPMVGADLVAGVDRFTEELFWRVLTSSHPGGRIELPAACALRPFQPGCAIGRLLAANLSLLVSCLGTSFSPDYRDAILALEDANEPPYRIDRMLTQLRNAGVLRRLGGLLVGQFTDAKPASRKTPSLSLDEVLAEVLEDSRIPVLTGLPYGHGLPRLTLPVGVRARLDGASGRLELLESGVR